MRVTSPTQVITRRDVLRGLGLSVLAVGTVGLLDGCGDEAPPGPVVSTDLSLAKSDVRRAEADVAAIGTGVTSIRGLGAGLWGQLSAEPGNLAISPFSVAVALGMTANGARRQTRDEMLTVLSSASVADLNAGLNAVAQHVESLAGPVDRWKGDDAEIALDAANALFGQQEFPWEQAFLDDLAASYGAGMQQVDYASDVEGAREAINAWTAEQTRDKIPELLEEGALNALARLVLVNALYLKAPWNEAFEKSRTQDGDFHLENGSVVSVPMMSTQVATTTSLGDGWRAARIPYAGGKIAMTVVQPDEGRSADVDAFVAADGLALLTMPGTPASVSLTMPRWTFRTPSPLGDALAALGMPTAFSETDADLSGMTKAEQLFVAAVQHEVFVKVDEEGTEAAAATGVVTQAVSAGPPPETLVLDRPFLFVIHDVEHGTPLFVGRVGDPRS